MHSNQISLRYRTRLLRILFAVTVLLCLLNTRLALATDPEELCNAHDTLVEQLSGKPHYERQALILKDEIPSQRHDLELFMNAGEGGRHSYSLIRTRRNAERTCIVSAGLIGDPSKDRQGHPQMLLRDENDPEIFRFTTCNGLYVLTRTGPNVKVGPDVDVCANVKALSHTPRLVVSYGRIVTDNRDQIPWPEH
jgi:hypothetical protein